MKKLKGDAALAAKTWKGEVKNRTKTGGEYWVESTITPLLDEEGKPYQYISIRTDITRQKLAAEKLAASEERLRRSQIYANIGTWDWDIQSGELYWSERIAPLFGYEEGALETTYENFLKNRTRNRNRSKSNNSRKNPGLMQNKLLVLRSHSLSQLEQQLARHPLSISFIWASQLKQLRSHAKILFTLTDIHTW